MIDSIVTIDTSSSASASVVPNDNEDAVNQFDYPNATTTLTTRASLPPSQHQDTDFDLFTTNAQVIPDHVAMDSEMTNNVHPMNDQNDHDNNIVSSLLVQSSPIDNSNNNHDASTNDETESTVLPVVPDSMTTATTTTMTSVTAPNTVSSPRFVSPNDFELCKVIGMGAFGKVLQVRNKCTQHVYAMKIISKRLLYKKGASMIDNVLVERDILQRISSHPFIVTMQCSFQTREKLFIIMDYLAGGELFLRLGREGIFLEKTAAFYLSEIILALEHLHNNNILHRDLKPENILLSCDGHVCITDFGLAKDFTRENDTAVSSSSIKPTTTSSTADTVASKNDSTTNGSNDGNVATTSSINNKNDTPPQPTTENDHQNDDQHRAKTICGTGEYMAPEMIARQGYGRSADYWSLGCIAYEMLSGRPPFDSKQGAKVLFLKIMTERIKMPSGSSAAACKLLKGLLNRNVSARLGAAKSTMFEVGGVAGLKKVDFFATIDWDKLLLKEIDPPATFSVDHDGDVQYFHDEFTSMPLPRSVVEMSMEHYQPKRVESEAFRGFSFIHDDFALPLRNEIEEKTYWESIEEDGESLSDCASSTMGNEPEIQSPTPSKRPPRKRKKKGVTTPGGNGDVTTTPIGTANNTPLGSTSNTPEPSECGEISDQLETLGINDDNVSPLVTNVIKAVIDHSKLNGAPNLVTTQFKNNSSPEPTPAAAKPIVGEEEWCVATGKRETPGKQKQRNNLTPHMNNNNANSRNQNSKTPVPLFTRGTATTTSFTPVNSRANGWNQVSSPSSHTTSTGERLQRLSIASSQQEHQSWRPTAGGATAKSDSSSSSGARLTDCRSSRQHVLNVPSSDWRNHSMTNRINTDQQQQRTEREQSYQQSANSVLVPTKTIPAPVAWPSLTNGSTTSTIQAPSESPGEKATKAPIVTGAWAARVSKS